MLCHLKVRRKKFRIYRCHPVYDVPVPITVRVLLLKLFENKTLGQRYQIVLGKYSGRYETSLYARCSNWSVNLVAKLLGPG